MAFSGLSQNARGNLAMPRCLLLAMIGRVWPFLHHRPLPLSLPLALPVMTGKASLGEKQTQLMAKGKYY